MENQKLTEEQISSIKYFWEGTGNLEIYVYFEELKPLIEKNHPELLKAWSDYKISAKILDAVIKSL